MLQRVGLAMLGILAVPAFVKGQYGDGYGAPPPPQVATPFIPAPAFNPMMTPEWQQAGGNYEAWQRLMMQKMAAQEQAAFQQQVQAYQAWAKANPKEAAALEKAYKAQMDPNPASTAARRGASRKKSTTKSATPAKGAKPAAKAASISAEPNVSTPSPTQTPESIGDSNAATTSKLKNARTGTAKATAPK